MSTFALGPSETYRLKHPSWFPIILDFLDLVVCILITMKSISAMSQTILYIVLTIVIFKIMVLTGGCLLGPTGKRSRVISLSASDFVEKIGFERFKELEKYNKERNLRRVLPIQRTTRQTQGDMLSARSTVPLANSTPRNIANNPETGGVNPGLPSQNEPERRNSTQVQFIRQPVNTETTELLDNPPRSPATPEESPNPPPSSSARHTSLIYFYSSVLSSFLLHLFVLALVTTLHKEAIARDQKTSSTISHTHPTKENPSESTKPHSHSLPPSRPYTFLTVFKILLFIFLPLYFVLAVGYVGAVFGPRFWGVLKGLKRGGIERRERVLRFLESVWGGMFCVGWPVLVYWGLFGYQHQLKALKDDREISETRTGPKRTFLLFSISYLLVHLLFFKLRTRLYFTFFSSSLQKTACGNCVNGYSSSKEDEDPRHHSLSSGRASSRPSQGRSSQRRALQEEQRPEPNRSEPVPDYGFGEEINRRVEINPDPSKSKYPIPRYLTRIGQALFSKTKSRDLEKLGLARKKKEIKNKDSGDRESVDAKNTLQKAGLALHSQNKTRQSILKQRIKDINMPNIREETELVRDPNKNNNSKKSSENRDWDLQLKRDSFKSEESVVSVNTSKLSFVSNNSSHHPSNPPEISQNPPQAAVSTPPRAPSQSEEDKLCVICFNRPVNCAVMPCGHSSLCHFCAINIFDDRGTCPICRKKIFQVLQIDKNRNENIYKVITAWEIDSHRTSNNDVREPNQPQDDLQDLPSASTPISTLSDQQPQNLNFIGHTSSEPLTSVDPFITLAQGQGWSEGIIGLLRRALPSEEGMPVAQGRFSRLSGLEEDPSDLRSHSSQSSCQGDKEWPSSSAQERERELTEGSEEGVEESNVEGGEEEEQASSEAVSMRQRGLEKEFLEAQEH